MRELGYLAGNPLEVSEPFFLVAPNLVILADAPGAPPQEPSGQRRGEVPRLADDKGNQHSKQGKAQESAYHRAARREDEDSVTG
jgi:hypothetical protein